MLAMKWIINKKGHLAACWISHGPESFLDTFRGLPSRAPFRARVRRSKPGLIHPGAALQSLRRMFPRAMALLVAGLILDAMVTAAACAAEWGPATSGPNFTGTAEVEPLGSWYYEPWAYGYHDLRYGSWEVAMPQRFALGLGYDLEADLYPNFILNTTGPPGTPPGISATRFGLGNLHFELKYVLTTDADT